MNISGGTVNASSTYGAGIGGGYGMDSGGIGSLYISGGSVNADFPGTVYQTSATGAPAVYLTTVSVSGIAAVTDVLCMTDAGNTFSCATDKDGYLYLWLAATSGDEQRTVLVGIPPTDPTAYYQASGEVKNDNTSAMTAELLNALVPLSISAQPTAQVIPAGSGTAALSVTAAGSGILTYQWYKNTTDTNSGGTIITGATASTYSVPTADLGTVYYCVVTAKIGSVSAFETSKAAAVTVTDALSGKGNGAYSVKPDVDAAYFAGLTGDGMFPTMTVNSGVTGFTYFSVAITAVTGHGGNEVCVFVQTRNGQQIGIMSYKGDFDSGASPAAGFNVKPGDVIEAYIVDSLSNSGGSPTIL